MKTFRHFSYLINVFPLEYFISTWLGNWKLLIIHLVFNIILDYLKKTVHKLFTRCSAKDILWNF